MLPWPHGGIWASVGIACFSDKESLNIANDLTRSQPLVVPWVLMHVLVRGGECEAFAVIFTNQ